MKNGLFYPIFIVLQCKTKIYDKTFSIFFRGYMESLYKGYYSWSAQRRRDRMKQQKVIYSIWKWEI